MSLRAYAAIEFAHPDFGAAPADTLTGAGPARVGQVDELGLRLSPQRQLAIVDESAAIRQALRILLTTRPGERVMRPAYGCNLHSLVFSPNDETTAGLAIHYVRQAVERWEPRVRVLAVDAWPGGAGGTTLDVVLDYLVLAHNRADRLVVPVALSGQDA